MSMAVEIRELLVRAKVEPGTGAEGEPGEPAATATPPPEGREAIVEECVRRVLRALERSKER
jgi:Family of unknown function (DUF5908)